MHFDISDSDSRSADVICPNGKHTLCWTYWSVAKTLHRTDNPPHRGAAELTISMKPSLRLDGDYWTERKTSGRIAATARSKHLYDDFESAERGTYLP